MSINIKNGKNVRLVMLHQTGTYSGLLAGVPKKDMNDSIIERVVAEANRTLYASDVQNIKVTLVPPEIKEQTIRLGADRHLTYPVLPGVITTIQIEDYDKHAVVVMFTHEIANRQEILDNLQSLDWDEISEEYAY